jgi:hypothetical protein
MASRRLYGAIVCNNFLHVQRYIENGGDPNVDLASFVTASRRVGEKTEITTLLLSLPEGIMSPLHLAVCNCCTDGEDVSHRRAAMKILRKLIDAGADTSLSVAINFQLCGNPSVLRPNVITAVTPCDLALRLKRFYTHTSNQMDEVIELLQEAAQKDRYAYKTQAIVTVPKSVAETFKALLVSEKFSDVKFKCQDGTTFHAHKNILAAASPYFSTAFEGPWGEQHQDGLWETSNSPAVMSAVLSFIYIGAVTPDLTEQQLLEMLAVASEYSLPCLRELCEASCARSLSVNNVKIVLQLAHLHGSSRLKLLCFDFVEKNVAKVLTNPSMAALAAEDAELWAELTASISPGENQSKLSSNKRGRSI